MSDYSVKQVKDITYEDELLAFNFDTGKIDKAKCAWISKPHTSDNYYRVTLSDNTVLKLIGWHEKCHRLFNVEQGAFLYPQDFKEEEHTLTDDNKLVTIVSIENLHKSVTYYNLTTKYRLNNFANNICVGSRLSNIYPIVGYKYQKEERHPISEFKSIPQHYVDELRLLEQPDQDPKTSIIYNNSLEEHIYNNYYKQDIRYRDYWKSKK